MEHELGRSAPTHKRWDATIAPAVRVQPGDVVHFATREVSDGAITRHSTAPDLAGVVLEDMYPLAGPVHVEGAEPGDALAVEVLQLRTGDWGWAAILPGAGLLPAGEFTEPYLRILELRDRTTTPLCDGVEIPIEPFLGTMGVTPAGARDVPVPPPHTGGGNIDCRHLTAGSRLLLPVFEPGALFSAGDAHAAQGDGEVAITGIECDMAFSLRFDLIKDARIPAPQMSRGPGSLTPRVDGGGWYATFGVEPDLMEASRAAVRAMIEHLVTQRGLTREDAYVLCSLAGDLKITEVVDAPNWMVGCYMPDAVFTR
ncbi:MAG: Acetamidase/Formamidase [Solirubrobacterales bacterium]|nr:Acetamidase/Formamidase [Solirubrobacterales bacterium]